MSDKAILVDGKVVPVDLMTWAKWFETADDLRIVDKTEVGDSMVSTVFLGLDHSINGGPKIWFETMIFGGLHADYQERYATIEEAREGHEKAVKMVKGDVHAD